MSELVDMAIQFVSLVDRGANGRVFAVKKRDGATDIRRAAPIVKVDTARRLVTGVVLEPRSASDPDTQGDWYTAAEIEKAAYSFMAAYGSGSGFGDVMHDGTTRAGEPRESWIAPADMTIGDQAVTKGSWLMTMHVPDDATWARIAKGDIGAFSIGGTGVRKAEIAPATFEQRMAALGLGGWLPTGLDALASVLWDVVSLPGSYTAEERARAASDAVEAFRSQLLERVADTILKRHVQPVSWTKGLL